MCYLKRSIYLGFIISVFSSLIILHAQQQPQQDERSQQLYNEYSQITATLQQTQEEALQDDEVVEIQNELEQKIKVAMIEENPKVEQKFEKRDNLIDDFRVAQQEGDQEKLASIQEQYHLLTQEIKTVEDKVNEKPEIKKESQKFEEKVIEKMEEINPDVPDLMTKLTQLKEEIQNLDQN